GIARADIAQGLFAEVGADVHLVGHQGRHRGAGGNVGADNLRLRQARNQLEQARLQLAYTEVRAERAGVVS
ncbi:hypothetical protein R0G64_31970, partial [Pseudomonas otitidis]|nr:hypothetical protein [Pseudomonas otitidis]